MDDRRKKRIAVLNDDRPILDLLDALLTEHGYDVKTRKEWDNAVGFIHEYAPDLVILDIMMGHQDTGWQVLELLTLDPRTRETPVIVSSAAIDQLHAQQENLDRLGVFAIEKPFDIDDLLRTIADALEKGPRARRR